MQSIIAKFIIYLLILVSSNLSSSEEDLPIIGDSSSSVISIASEYNLGRLYMAQLRRTLPEYIDPVSQDYSEHLVYRLSEFSELSDRRLEIALIDEKSVNAFAAPGGIIGINAGLIFHADTEGQLASVLSHELAHLSQRHFARQILESSDRSNASMAAILASIVVAVTTRSPAAILGGQGLLATQRLRFSRLYETEADREGFVTLENSGYDTSEMAEMFKNMQELRRLSGDNVPEFLLTHPITTRRITESRERARGSEGGTVDSLNFKLIKQRVKFLMTDNLSIKAFEKEIGDTDEDLYFSALIEKKKLNFTKSIEILELLEAKYPDNLIIKTSKAEVYTESGNVRKSKDYTKKLLEVSLGNYPLSYNLANAYILEENYLAAEQILEDIKFYRPVDINLLKDLSAVQKSSNNMLGYHLTNSEFLFYSGRYEEALRDLQEARRIARNNFKIREIITERILILQTYVKSSRRS